MPQTVNRIVSYFIFGTIFTVPTALACSYVGDPPTGQYRIDNAESIIESADIVFLGTVETVDLENYRNTIRVDEHLRGSIADEGATIEYEPPTSCDELLRVQGETLLIYGSYLGNQPYLDYFRLKEIELPELLNLLQSHDDE